MRPFGGPYAAAERAAVQSLIDGGDKGLIFVDTTGWLSPAIIWMGSIQITTAASKRAVYSPMFSSPGLQVKSKTEC